MTCAFCAVAFCLALSGCEITGPEGEPPTGPVAPDPIRGDPPFKGPDPDDPVVRQPVPRPQQNAVEPEAPPRREVGDVSDQAVTEQVRQRLASDEWFSPMAREIDVTTLSGVVTLRGSVQSEDERQAVLDAVRNVHGVRNVNDELEVREEQGHGISDDY